MHKLAVRFVALLWMLDCAPLCAQTTGIDSCRAIDDATARLRCYDRVAGHEASVPSDPLPPATGDAAPLRDEKATSEQDFGKRERQSNGPAQEMRARIVAVERTPLRKSVMTLDNGQVWMQNEGSPRRVEPDQEIVIVKLRFSYTMTLESGRSLKVHRVR